MTALLESGYNPKLQLNLLSNPGQERRGAGEKKLYIYNKTIANYNLLVYSTGMKSRKIYNRIQVFRNERNLSRQELADLVGVNYQTIGYLEREEYNPSLDLAFRLAEVFGLPVEMVFSTSPMKPLSHVLRDQLKKERD
jgi:DNA-binding XRE family transcriptional regulator